MAEFTYCGEKLTGISELKGVYSGKTAVFVCSGTSLDHYDDMLPPRHWKRFAINEGIRRLEDRADFWVLSDDPIVLEYSQYCSKKTKILCMQQATRIIRRHCKMHTIYTVESMAKPGKYDNGFQFYSRGTVLIGAIEMARYMGFTRFFIFGLDCYRTKGAYYFGNHRQPHAYTENSYNERCRVPDIPDEPIYVTPKLRNMIEKLGAVRNSGLWSNGMEIWCVGSPYSQQTAIEKMPIEYFRKICVASKEVWREPEVDPVDSTITEKLTLQSESTNKSELEETQVESVSESEHPRRRGRPRRRSDNPMEGIPLPPDIGV